MTPPEKPPLTSAPLAVSARARRDFRAELGRWFAQAGRDLPWRRLEEDAYAVFVSEMMLQQTQVATVIPYFARWLQRFPTVLALAAAEEAEVLSVWQGLGYYARARHLHRAAREVVSRHGGLMPRTVADLQALPGAGRYTAGAIASFAYDQPEAAVDANIGRVLARLFEVEAPIDTSAGRDALWAAAELLLPVRVGGRKHNSALMELGALICTPRQPRCLVCPVRRYCAAREPETLPRKSARRATVAQDENCAWQVANGKLLLEQQTGRRWRGLWKLPRVIEPPVGEPLWQAVYPFTHHRVTLRVYAAEPGRKAAVGGEAWFTEAEWLAVALAAPHRRAIEGLWSRDVSAEWRTAV